MKRRAEDEYVRLRRTGIGNSAIKPAPASLALNGASDMLVVLRIIDDDERRPLGPVASATDFSSRAQGFNNYAVGQADAILSPGVSPPHHGGIRFG
jgi:hypothetical protein